MTIPHNINPLYWAFKKEVLTYEKHKWIEKTSPHLKSCRRGLKTILEENSLRSMKKKSSSQNEKS
jgi:hypothetical protein